MKYYKVTVYDVKCDDYYDGIALYVDEIIVGRSLNSALELFTEYEIPIIPKKGIIQPYQKVTPRYQNQNLYNQTGHQLVVFAEDFTEANLAQITDIKDYDYYENFARVYDEIQEKVGIEEEKVSLKRLIKQKKGTQKGKRYDES